MVEELGVAVWSLAAGGWWEELSAVVHAIPDIASVDFGNGCRLLHLVLSRSAPPQIVEEVVSAYPGAVETFTHDVPHGSESCFQTRLTKLTQSIPSASSPISLAVSRGSADKTLLAVMPSRVRHQRYFEFDPTKYRLQEELTNIILPTENDKSGCDHNTIAGDNTTRLENLHLTDDAGRYTTDFRPVARHAGRMIFNKRYRQERKKSPSFKKELALFVKEVVAPLLWGSGSSGEIVYQQEPTLRVHLPGQEALGNAHIDYHYKRQPTEVNVWLPLTSVGPSNSLWAESEPGKGDFSPFVAHYGKAVLFWGSQCQHYSTKNTAATTRVSLDFRVIRGDEFIEEYISPMAKAGAPSYFLKGKHYSAIA
eukprot:m.179400 g.179400  ORF g.179400 m.179400 type:complete len:366 (-) comp31973_c0_seq1:2377-3474(-)